MAGTGKSTVAYTVAERLSAKRVGDHTKLGASFFFKRGEGDRASAALFFPTIVRQLCRAIPDLVQHVDRAIHNDPDICDKALGEQFRTLFEGPLSKLIDAPKPVSYVVIVDALDQCKREDDIQTLLQLWSRSSQRVHCRIQWFVTSRPELAIQVGFSRMLPHVLQNVALHEIPLPTIRDDISIFLTHAFSRIRDEYNLIPLSGTPLPQDWPGVQKLDILTNIAAPLFIVAATICRFVQDKYFNPRDQLDIIIQSQEVGKHSDLGQVYLPILEKAITCSARMAVKERLYREFRMIVGAIIIVAEPLSRLDLAALLQMPSDTISLRLRPLCSVLQVPVQGDVPIRSLHLSFGEFLTSNEIDDQPFWVNQTRSHALLLRKCLDLMSHSPPVGLDENMCQLNYPGQPRGTLSKSSIGGRLSFALQYACRYWTYHAQQSTLQICDGGDVHCFLQTHFLHWLEALSLTGNLFKVIDCLRLLQTLLPVDDTVQISAFLEDARRFILTNTFVLDSAPAQLYSSAVVFAPHNSIVRQVCGKIPGWLKQTVHTPISWEADLLKFECEGPQKIAFSPDGLRLVSGTHCGLILWDTKTGQEIQRLDEFDDIVDAVAFSPDGKQLASGSGMLVRIWDLKTGQELQRLTGHTDMVCTLAFSPDGLQLASGSWACDGTVRLWNIERGHAIHKLGADTAEVRAIAFAPDGSQLASASDHQLCLWDTKTGHKFQTLGGAVNSATGVGFSPDGSLVISVSLRLPVRLWSVKTGQEVRRMGQPCGSMALSFCGSQIALHKGSAIYLWDVETGALSQMLRGHTDTITAVAFSPDGQYLASASWDATVRIWDTKTDHGTEIVDEQSRIEKVVFSADGSSVAAAATDHTVRITNTKTGYETHLLDEHTGAVKAIAFSPDGSRIVSASYDETLRLWDTDTGRELLKLQGHTDPVYAVAYSPDGSRIASGSQDTTLRLWDASSGTSLQVVDAQTSGTIEVVFSPDNSRLATVDEYGCLRLWDTGNGRITSALNGCGEFVTTVAFSPSGSELAARFSHGPIGLLDAETGRTVRTLQTHEPVFQMRYLRNTTGLLTNAEIIYFNSEPKPALSSDVKQPSDYLFIKGDWIWCGTQKLLWLPHDYRSNRSIIHGNMIAIAHASGRVKILRIEYPKETRN